MLRRREPLPPPYAGPAGDVRALEAPDASLPPAFSVWLDLLRATAAIVVLLAHAANLRFTDGVLFEIRRWTLAPDAVIVFFVVSGLVVARAADRDGTAARFAFARVTRLASVVVPALALTWALDQWGRTIDPSAYPPRYFMDLPAATFALRGLTLTGEWRLFGDPILLGTNAPLWSLSFEATYYVLLGLALFARGWWRALAILAVAAAAGLPILLLLPAWLIGVAVWRWHCRVAPAVPRGLGLILAVSPIALLVALKLSDIDGALLTLTRRILDTDPWERLGYAREAPWNLVIALCLGLHLVGMRAVAPALPAGAVRAVRWLAGASFSIYVVHYPVLHVLDAIVPEELPAKVVIFVAVPLAAGLVFAEVFERPLPRLRRWLTRRRHPA